MPTLNTLWSPLSLLCLNTWGSLYVLPRSGLGEVTWQCWKTASGENSVFGIFKVEGALVICSDLRTANRGPQGHRITRLASVYKQSLKLKMEEHQTSHKIVGIILWYLIDQTYKIRKLNTHKYERNCPNTSDNWSAQIDTSWDFKTFWHSSQHESKPRSCLWRCQAPTENEDDLAQLANWVKTAQLFFNRIQSKSASLHMAAV